MSSPQSPLSLLACPSLKPLSTQHWILDILISSTFPPIPHTLSLVQFLCSTPQSDPPLLFDEDDGIKIHGGGGVLHEAKSVRVCVCYLFLTVRICYGDLCNPVLYSLMGLPQRTLLFIGGWSVSRDKRKVNNNKKRSVLWWGSGSGVPQSCTTLTRVTFESGSENLRWTQLGSLWGLFIV